MRYQENGVTLLDYFTIKRELNINDTTLIRLIKKLNISVYPYKNQNLIKESDFELIANAILKNNNK